MINQIDLLDLLNVLSFYIGLKNLDENMSQNTATELITTAVKDIHGHLKEQDDKINQILEVLNNEKN